MVQLEKLGWDSGHFGIKVGRLTLEDIDDASSVKSALANSGMDVVISRTETEDIRRTSMLEDVGFRVKDVRLHLDLDFNAFAGRKRIGWPTVRLYGENDRDAVGRISRESFWSTHFHFDQRFSREKVDEMYDAWIGKAVKDGYFMYVALYDSEIAGFIASKDVRNEYYIELVAVDGKFRGKGVAERLVLHALNVASKGFARASIGVQLQNIAAVRLYEKIGFRINSSDFTLHWWRNA